MRFERTAVLDGLATAGWFSGRTLDVDGWLRIMQAEGFVISNLARDIWIEFGGLRVVRQAGNSTSSLFFDPVDAASGAISEARRLAVDYGENLSPIGLWSAQYRAYIAESGWVLAIGPGWDWKLGEDLEDALDLVIAGNREIVLLRTTKSGAPPFPGPGGGRYEE